MSFVLHVDAARWRAAQDAAAARYPGVVPVVKGNGYGFGRDLLCAEAGRLGASTVAVGLYAELGPALDAFAGDVLVMEPFRARVHDDLARLDARQQADAGRGVHTVTSAVDLEALREVAPRARVVVEALTSMNRFGAPVAEVADLARRADAEGVTLHLPLGTGHVEEISRFVDAAPDVRRWYVSHTSPGELAELARRHPGRELLPRVGTSLWLADPAAHEVRAHVLDVRPVGKGEHAGYRQRPLAPGHVVVVSGGTSHGVAMESPASAATPRARAVAVVEGLREAAHRVTSPFTVGGRRVRFAEPPHMQCSLLSLPAGGAVPSVGDTVPVRMRLTTAYPDAVELH